MFKESDIEVISQILAQHPLTGSIEIPDWPTRISSFMHQVILLNHVKKLLIH